MNILIYTLFTATIILHSCNLQKVNNLQQGLQSITDIDPSIAAKERANEIKTIENFITLVKNGEIKDLTKEEAIALANMQGDSSVTINNLIELHELGISDITLAKFAKKSNIHKVTKELPNGTFDPFTLAILCKIGIYDESALAVLARKTRIMEDKEFVEVISYTMLPNSVMNILMKYKVNFKKIEGTALSKRKTEINLLIDSLGYPPPETVFRYKYDFTHILT